jgi:hypothetical protein
MVTNENDENGIGATRVTRAKAAALTSTTDDHSNISKKPLQTKRSAASANTLNGQRRRAALGDVTNASKGAEIQDEKKALGATKPTLASKAARPTGVQKLNRTNSARSALGVKENNVKAKSGELKRPGSGSGILGDGHRKRVHTSTSTVQSAEDADDPPKQTVSQAPSVTKEEVKVTAQAFQEAFHDLDAEDIDDPLMVAEYVGEIFEYYRTLETLTMPNPDYMDHQDDLEWKMRGILIDWLIEVHTRFRLLPETLFLAVNIIDRFLSQKVVPLDKLQLVGVTAMFIASKYEEVLSPHIGNFVHVADDGFTVEEVLSAERYTLQTLKYDLSYPNPMNFLRRISKADNYDIQTRTIGKYLMEISLVDHRFMRYPQSHVAATAMYVARLILESGPWVR